MSIRQRLTSKSHYFIGDLTKSSLLAIVSATATTSGTADHTLPAETPDTKLRTLSRRHDTENGTGSP
jgi:hypothetical protein